MDELTDVRYEVDRGLAWITIDRPDRLNALRGRTVDELMRCFKLAWASADVGVVCLTGAGERAFCTGGDQKQRAETGDYGPSASRLVRGREPPSRHPRGPQARHRRRQRLRHRRRPRAGRARRPGPP